MYRRVCLMSLLCGSALAAAAALAGDEVIRPKEVAIPEAPGKMVSIEITLFKLEPGALGENAVGSSIDLSSATKGWGERGQIKGSDRIEFTTLERHKTTVQYGARVPIVTSTQFTGRTNELVHGIALEDTGFMVVAESTVEPDGAILLGLVLERSSFEPTPPFKVIPLDPANPPKVTNEPHPTAKTTQIYTAVRLHDKAVLIGRRAETDGEAKSEYVAFASAKVAD